jgi:TatD DNase family protein
MRYLDIHAHRRSTDGEVETVLTNLVTAETEDLIDDLPCSVGIHPRSIEEGVDEDLLLVRELAADPAVIAIGECGLDRACSVSWADQIRVFEDQISISELHCKPIIVHCVRAHADVITIHRDIDAIQPWVLHGFNKGGDTLERVIEAGLYVSFGAAIMQQDSPAVEALRSVPADRFFLETDDQTEHDIRTIYARAAEIRGVTIDALCETLQQNFDSVFKP